jgi:hypothetical protein
VFAAFICIYLLYILVVIFGRLINQRWLSRKEGEEEQIKQINQRIVDLNGVLSSGNHTNSNQCIKPPFMITATCNEPDPNRIRDYSSIRTSSVELDSDRSKRILKRRSSCRNVARTQLAGKSNVFIANLIRRHSDDVKRRFCIPSHCGQSAFASSTIGDHVIHAL